MSDIEQKTELFDEQQEETRANQAIDSDVQREEARGEAADGDYTDAQYYGNNSYLEAPFSSPLLLFGAHSLSPPLSFGEQLPVSSSRKRKPQTALSTITSEQADSVLGNPIENSGEEEQQNSVTVVLSGKQVLLPCLRTFETGTYTRGTGNDPDEPDNVEMFGASNITGQVTPPSGLYDDAGQVVLRSLASGPSNVVTTSMLMGRDRASKDRAKANKDKNKETKLFPQFENKMGSPKMTNVPFGEPAVVQTSVGLRYLAADDRAMLGRDAALRNINVTAPEYSYGTKSKYPRLSLINFPRPNAFTTYSTLNNQLTEHAFTSHIVERPRKAAEHGGDGAEQATPKKSTKKPAKKPKKQAVQATLEPPVTDDEEIDNSVKIEEDEQMEQDIGLGPVLTAQLKAAQRAQAEDTIDLTGDDTTNLPADQAAEHVAEQLPEEPETPIQHRLLDMLRAAPEAVAQAEDDLRDLLINAASSNGSLLGALAERGMLSRDFVDSLQERIERGEIEHQDWVDGVLQAVHVGLNSAAMATAAEDAAELAAPTALWQSLFPEQQQQAAPIRDADNLTLENLTIRDPSEQNSPTRLVGDEEPVVPLNTQYPRSVERTDHSEQQDDLH